MYEMAVTDYTVEILTTISNSKSISIGGPDSAPDSILGADIETELAPARLKKRRRFYRVQ